MKRKGITIFEQHIERIVLGAAVLFFLGFGAFQFMRSPHDVKLSGTRTVAPSEIDAILKEKALELQQKLKSDAKATIELPAHRPVVTRFEAQLAEGISPEETLARLDPQIWMTENGQELVGVLYHEPEIIAPSAVATVQTFDGLVAEMVAEDPELRERFEAAPYDVTWLTAAAVFDVSAVAKEYADAGAEDRSAIPLNWYGGRVEILDVRLEREEYIDGSWSDRQTVELLSGAFSLRPQLADVNDRATGQAILAARSEPGIADEIERPDFFETIGDAFIPPDPRADEPENTANLTPEEIEAQRIEADIRRNLTERDRLLEKLEKLGGSMSNPDETEKKEGDRDNRGREEEEPTGGRSPSGGRGPALGGGGRRTGGGGRAPAGGGIGGPRSGGPSTGGNTRDTKRAQERLKTKIRGINSRIAERRSRLETLIGKPVDEQVNDEESSGELVVWAHDLAIVPGRTYRYRFFVDVYNPFYGRKLSLLEEQHSLADSITIASAASPWSEPREVEPGHAVFVDQAFAVGGAKNPGELRIGQAKAEVFRFSHGRWWRETFTVQPGDRIGWRKPVEAPSGDPATVDFGTGWFVLDVISDLDSERPEQEKGYGAVVLLQDLVDDDRTTLLDPRETDRSQKRSRLIEAVDDAEREQELASN